MWLPVWYRLWRLKRQLRQHSIEVQAGIIKRGQDRRPLPPLPEKSRDRSDHNS